MKRHERTSWAALACLFAIAAAYCLLGCDLTLGSVDEGGIAYLSWLVSQGLVPDRDFEYVYGPSFFFLNGGLFWLFGIDLHVIKISVALVRAVNTVLVYVAARRVAPLPYALVAYALMVAVWGTPLEVFNAPYANHYAMAINLAGLLLYLDGADRPRRASFIAGCCFGVSSTFKITSGVFALLAFVLFQLFLDTASAASNDRPPTAPPAGRMRVLRIGMLLAVLGVVLPYQLRAENTPWNAAVLLTPLLASAALLLERERRCPITRPSTHLWNAMVAVIGSAVPMALYLVYYAMIGAPGEPLLGQLQRLSGVEIFFVFPPLYLRTAMFTLAVIAMVASIRWITDDAHRSIPRRRLTGLALLSGVVMLFALAARLPLADSWFPDLVAAWWYPDVWRMLFFVPLVAIWASFPAVFFRSPPPALALFFFYAVTSLSYLYPIADYWHVTMCLPAFLPLVAHALARLVGVQRTHDNLVRAGAVLAVIVAFMAAPFVHTLIAKRLAVPANPPTFARASGFPIYEPKFINGAAVIDYVNTHEPPGRKLFVLGGGHFLYFLSGRSSIFNREFYVLHHLLYFSDAGARSKVSESAVVARFRAEQPLVIVEEGHPWAQRFRESYPVAAAYLDTHCPVASTLANYRLLDCRDAGA